MSAFIYDSEYSETWEYKPLGNLGTSATIVKAINDNYVVLVESETGKIFKNILDAKLYSIAICARRDMELFKGTIERYETLGVD